MVSPTPHDEPVPPKTAPALDAEGGRDAAYSSRELFGDKTEIRIEHQGELYRLRITRSGGLLLNK